MCTHRGHGAGTCLCSVRGVARQGLGGDLGTTAASWPLLMAASGGGNLTSAGGVLALGGDRGRCP